MKWLSIVLAFAMLAVPYPAKAQELLFNPGFEDLGGGLGEGWGNFGNADFNAFFGPNGHASFFSDGNDNFGGVFQSVDLADAAGMIYRFDLLDVRIEANTDANYRFGLEYYLADDSTATGPFDIVSIPIPPTGDGLSFSMTGVAPAGTQIVRPIIQFDNAVSAGGGQENVFVFETSLTKVPEPATLLLAGLAGAAAACGLRWRAT